MPSGRLKSRAGNDHVKLPPNMLAGPPPCLAAAMVPPAGERFSCGTLVYTRAGLFTLFAWLLWGDFCFSLMEAVWPNVLPLMLKGEGTPNTVISLVVVTIPNAMNFFLNPVISTWSDRHRGKRGRRIPFLLAATPFVTALLVLLGFSRSIIGWGQQIFAGLPPSSIAITVISVLMVTFLFFELFINTVFWYLFNDVVPTAFMGRFLGLFRIIGSLAGALFNFFILQYAESHASVLFFGVAALYGSAFLLMTLNIREGSYPPPPSTPPAMEPLIWVKNFFSDCLSHRLFRRVYTYSALQGVGNAASVFLVFMALSIGLSLSEIGKVAGVASVIGMILMYPMGALVDRFHPIRVMLLARVGFCAVVSVKFLFLFHEFSRPAAFWIYVVTAGLAIPINVAGTAASLPLVMRLFPKDKFGQFCSINAMAGALGTMLGGLLAGLFFDEMRKHFQGDYYYRFAPVWQVCFTLPAVGMMYLVYREWKRLGGDRDFNPPILDRFKTPSIP